MMADIDRVEAQRRIDAVLRRGIVFSLVWLAGIGSLIAILSGLKAKRLMARLGPEASGTGRVWWCLIVGGVGLLIWGPIIIMAVSNNLARELAAYADEADPNFSVQRTGGSVHARLYPPS